jgi:hypothetical protein
MEVTCMAGQTFGSNNSRTLRQRSVDVQQYKELGILLLVCVVSLLSSGCPTAVQYPSNDRMIDELGLPQARQRLQEVLLRSINPKIDTVESTDEFLRYHLAGTTYEVRVFFKDMQRVDVYDNRVVLVRDRQGLMLMRPLFANAADAEMFANLLVSFRAHHAPGSSSTR